MAEQDKQLLAAQETFIKFLNSIKCPYKVLPESEYDNGLTLVLNVVGEDLPMEIIVEFQGKPYAILAYSRVCKIQEDKRESIPYLLAAINYTLPMGVYIYNDESGVIYYKVHTSFENSNLSEKTCEILFDMSVSQIDLYNDKLVLYNSGILSFDDFMKFIME